MRNYAPVTGFHCANEVLFTVPQAMLALSDTGHLLRFVQRDNLIDLKARPACAVICLMFTTRVYRSQAVIDSRDAHDAVAAAAGAAIQQSDCTAVALLQSARVSSSPSSPI